MAARHLAGDLLEEAPQDTDDEAVPNYVGRHFRGTEQAEAHELEPAIEEDSAEPELELEDLTEAEDLAGTEAEAEVEPEPEPEPEPEAEPALEPVEELEEPEPEPEPVEEPEPEFEPVPEDEPDEEPAPKEAEPEPARETYVASSASPMFVDLFDEPLDEPLDEPVVEPTIEPLDEASGEDDSREDSLSSTQELSGVVSPTMPEPVRITDEHEVDLETLDPTLAMQRIRVRTRKDGLDDTIPINRNDVRDAIRKVMPVAGETSPRLDVQRRSHDSREGAIEGRQESVPVIRMESNEIVPKDDKGSSRTGRAIVTRERRRPFGFLATFGEFISRLLHLDDRR